VSVSALLREAAQRIGHVDARVLLSHVLGRDSAFLIAHGDAEVGAEPRERYAALVARRTAGEPVAFLAGEREFYGRRFAVTSDVLIPRPETELLVDLALERLPADSKATVADLGTGSGCIAVTLASERSHSRIIATDQSLGALDVARSNASAHAVDVEFLQSDWYSALSGMRFDVIVANPPYVAAGDPHLAEGDLRFEPLTALTPGPEGLEAIREIVSGGVRHLATGGWLLVEHGHDQAAAVRALFAAAGYSAIFAAEDLAGIERVTGARLTVPVPDR
jgi:release factor glutamine methyltransferase